MAKFGSDAVAFFLVDGFSLMGDMTQFSEETEAVTEETTGLGDSWQEHLATGLRKATLTQQGFYDDGAAAVNAALSELQQTSRIVCHGVAGNTIGKGFVGYAGAFGSKYSRLTSRGELHKANVDYTITGQKDDGIILHALTAETANGDTEGANSQDFGASSSAGGVGYLQWSTLTLGTATNLVVNVRHSADDITYASLITFTAATAARGAERKTVAGTVNRHTAASWSWTGGAGGGSTATFMVGFSRG